MNKNKILIFVFVLLALSVNALKVSEFEHSAEYDKDKYVVKP